MPHYSFALAWDEGDIDAPGPGDAGFLNVLNPNSHISLPKCIRIIHPKRHPPEATENIREIVRRISPFHIFTSTDLWHHGSAICLTVATQPLAMSNTTKLRSDILKILIWRPRFDRPHKSWCSVADSEKRGYNPHITVRRNCESSSVADTLKTCSDAIRNHAGPTPVWGRALSSTSHSEVQGTVDGVYSTITILHLLYVLTAKILQEARGYKSTFMTGDTKYINTVYEKQKAAYVRGTSIKRILAQIPELDASKGAKQHCGSVDVNSESQFNLRNFPGSAEPADACRLPTVLHQIGAPPAMMSGTRFRLIFCSCALSGWKNYSVSASLIIIPKKGLISIES
ncbi:hypothetical protein B0H17DRAFT_1184891 [Mycena rosella]|uniref:Uncharacterized protein n=1 Tax=Mycena rosella TaxID=1033263 RepID=A0AAD7G3C1_MYCRO|nr:hypothetical protein B0H17DRAFT_1184891 [Mycena rosella]